MVSGWKKVAISEIADVKTGPFGSTLHSSDYADVGTPIITVEHLGEYAITRQNLPLVSDADKKRLSAYILSEGDLVFSRVGSVDRNAYVTEAENGWLFSGRLLRIRAYPETVDPKYLGYYFKYEPTKVRIRGIAVGQTMASLNTKLLNSFMVVLPSIPEQHAIAEALSDADSYIVSLEKLIAKKKAIKQGAMQELLTGKRRLPGLDGDWVSINLAKKSILKARIGWQGLTTAEYRNEGYSYLITGTDFLNGRIDWNGCHYVDKFRFDQDANIQVKNDDVLITKDGTIGKVALVEGLEKNATLNSGIFVIRPINGAYNNLFVYFVLSSEIFADFLAKLSAGSTINHLYQKDFVGFEFFAPVTIEEQKAIAQILFYMDREIEALIAKLNKAKFIKQGMMQELMTGRIRLVQPETATVVTAKSEVLVAAAAFSSAQKGHNQQFDDAVMIAGIVSTFYTDRYPLGRKKVQKLLYLLRRKQDESMVAFKKKAAGPYAGEVRYKGGEKIAKSNRYIAITTIKGKGTTFAQGENIGQALDYIERWGRQGDIEWLAEKFRYTSVDDLELLATVDMAICDLEETGTTVSVASIKHLIATNEEWRAKLQKKTFADSKIAKAISDLQTLL